MKTIARMGLAASVMLAVVGFSAPAHAGDYSGGDGTVTGGDISGPGEDVSTDIQQQNAVKDRVAQAYYAAKYGTGTLADLAAANAAYQAAYPQAVAGPLAAGTDAATASATLITASAAFAVNKLGVVQFGQAKSYYCGPASGKMIVYYKGDGTSAFNGETQTQAHIADSYHMRTDINGKTSWARGCSGSV